ncbi:hypothetical protein AN639_12005 [Candidatus Epulonipiscium fishelsonii]|uniref:Uncharacterized protein n=1 Tax=Candidatus Epulonipiscium fishelsonii TaxID=77094 RepID=A0ACC8XCI8_9FIRM|nr:hypothetical protein AN396_06050 [Epulopiscium sp. SCG-B11WGA-EpuloA1]ONI42728.1 hypothetical protein AN639_12005 [Epulopiscium sp. SCG-B05WGA-EpuloA1]
MNKYKGLLGLIIVTVLWGGGFVAADIALNSITPFQIMTSRFGIASIILFFVAKKDLKTITKNEIKCGILLGSFLFAAFSLQTVGLQFTTPSKNAFLTSIYVAIVPFISYIFLKKKTSIANIIGVILVTVGAGILSLQSNFSIGVGDSLSIIGAFCYAFQIFFTGEFVNKIRPSILNFIQMVTSFTLSFISLGLTREYVNFSPSTESLTAILYLGLISTTLCYFLQTYSQQFVEETQVAIILSMESVFGTIFAAIILNDLITTRMLIGSSCIFIGVIISQLKLHRGQNRFIRDSR